MYYFKSIAGMRDDTKLPKAYDHWKSIDGNSLAINDNKK